MRSPSQAHRAEHLSRQAAANAHAAYYAHPSLHLHTYLPKKGPDGQALPDSEQDGAVVQALNGPAPSAASPDPDTAKKGTEGTREEEGGKDDAGAPSSKDKGALEPNGEAGGTHTHPGPTAQEVEQYKRTQQSSAHSVANGHQVVSGAAPVAGGAAGEDVTAVQSMEPHLQMMCGPLLSYYTTINNVWQGGVMVVTQDK